MEQGHRYSLRRGHSVCFSSFNQNRRNCLGGSYHQPFGSHNTVTLGTSVAKDGTESSEKEESWSAVAWLRVVLQEFMTLTFSQFLQKPGEFTRHPVLQRPWICMCKTLYKYSNIFLSFLSWLQTKEVAIWKRTWVNHYKKVTCMKCETVKYNVLLLFYERAAFPGQGAKKTGQIVPLLSRFRRRDESRIE